MEIKELYQKLFMMEIEGIITSSKNKYKIRKEEQNEPKTGIWKIWRK